MYILEGITLAGPNFKAVVSALDDLARSGQNFVEIEALKNFIDGLSSDSPVDPDTRKLLHESNLAYYKAQRDIEVEHFKSVIETGKVALTTAILVNGGASVAVLTMVGSLVIKTTGAPFPGLSYIVLSLTLFSIATLCGAVATGATYCTQALYAKDWMKSGYVAQGLTIALVMASYILFAFGVLNAYKGFN